MYSCCCCSSLLRKRRYIHWKSRMFSKIQQNCNNKKLLLYFIQTYLSTLSLWNPFYLSNCNFIYRQWRVCLLNAIPFYGFETYHWFTMAYPKFIQTHQIVLIILIAIIFPFIPILIWSSGVTSYRRSTPYIWWCLSRWWWSQTSLPTKRIIKLSCYTKMLDRLNF